MCSPRTARDEALRVLLAVDREGAYANLAMQGLSFCNGLNTHDRALLTELVYGTLRMQNALDWVIGRFSRVPVARMNYIVRNIIRLGVYQLLFLGRIPASAACDEAVKQAKSRKLGDLAGFVNGLLRSIARNRDGIDYPARDEDPVLHVSVKYSHPAWLVERWLNRYGLEETIALCRANNEPPPVVLRCNTLKIEPDRLRGRLEREGVAATTSPLLTEGLRLAQQASVAGLPSYREGLFAVQDESSMLASIALRPEPGSFTVDACAGPGGKTGHLAQIMKNSGRLLAFDIHEHRLQLIREACQRLGVTIASACLQDAAIPPVEILGKVDYLLVDAPCSGIGVIRRRPDLRWRARQQDQAIHAMQQKHMLIGISKCLRKGGLMLYSTCSTEPEENMYVVSDFLAEHREWMPQDMTGVIPGSFLHSEDDRRMAEGGCLQLLPHRHGTDGFFLALLKRKESRR